MLLFLTVHCDKKAAECTYATAGYVTVTHCIEGTQGRNRQHQTSLWSSSDTHVTAWKSASTSNMYITAIL